MTCSIVEMQIKIFTVTDMLQTCPRGKKKVKQSPCSLQTLRDCYFYNGHAADD